MPGQPQTGAGPAWKKAAPHKKNGDTRNEIRVLPSQSREPRVKPFDSTPQDHEEFFKKTQPAIPGDKWKTYEQDVIKHAREKEPERYKDLSDTEMLAIVRYSQNDFKELNKAMRSGTPEEKAAWAGYKNTLNSALSKLPPYDGWVCRGSPHPGNFATNYELGKIVRDRAFVSTCAGSDTAGEFRGEWEYFVKPKTGRYIEDLSVFGYDNMDVNHPKSAKRSDAREAEVLFATDTPFLVVGRETSTTYVPYDAYNYKKPKDAPPDQKGEYVTKTFIYLMEI